MRYHSFWKLGLSSLLVLPIAGSFSPGNWAWGQADQGGSNQIGQPGAGDSQKDDDVSPPTPTAEMKVYRIGILCVPVPPLLQHHLPMEGDTGLVIESVVDGSPADQSGIQRFDVIVSMNGEPVSDAAEFTSRVQGSKDQEIELSLLRRGKTITVRVKPRLDVVRPANPLGQGPAGWEGHVPPDLQRLMEQWERQGFMEGWSGDGNPMWQRFMPGFWMEDDGQEHAAPMKFPSNFSLQIEKNNDGPAKIKVQRGNDHWELTEDNLDQLPDDVRPMVENMLRGSRPGQFLPRVRRFVPGMENPAVPGRVPGEFPREFPGKTPREVPRAIPGADPGIHRRLEGLELQLKQIQDAIRSVQGASGQSGQSAEQLPEKE